MTISIPLQRLEGKYEILEKLSEGGMGAIYKVRHRLLDEVRVVKVMRPHLADDEVLRARFMREAKVAIRLKHPNIAQVYDFTMDEEGYFFLVMEFIEGMDLFALVRSVRPVPLGVVIEIADQSLAVLGYLHRKEIIHRDISPDNLLVSRDDEGGLLIKLIDLGIAKIQEADEHLTATGAFLGKVRYSSPEQFRTEGGAEIGPKSDLYSFGIVLYELLTAKYPIKGKNISSLISGHLLHTPLSFEESDPERRIPEELRTIVLRALEKDAEKRFPSARAFRTKLSELREKYPIGENDVREIFEIPALPTSKIKIIKPGSTQDHLNRSFGVETTPAHTAPTVAESDHDGAEKGKLRKATEGASGAAVGEADRQVRALLLGAEKLIGNKHFDEARLQIEAVRGMVPESPEISRLLKILNDADTKLKAGREAAVRRIEALVEQEQFVEARLEINASVKRIGEASCFTEMEEMIAEAEVEAEARAAQLADILDAVRGLITKDEWEDAAPMAREALTVDPTSVEATGLLRQAEAGISRLREAERRQKEIEKTARTIEEHLRKEKPDKAREGLLLARK
ncbi:MAG: serine/threonine protein kinase, partial [Thermoanaerobaculales bacterium]|nr:serine/threonine protein kinase [Thermoanaerobaculales bacterium]